MASLDSIRIQHIKHAVAAQMVQCEAGGRRRTWHELAVLLVVQFGCGLEQLRRQAAAAVGASVAVAHPAKIGAEGLHVRVRYGEGIAVNSEQREASPAEQRPSVIDSDHRRNPLAHSCSPPHAVVSTGVSTGLATKVHQIYACWRGRL